jgi:hypothetical protein
MNKEQQELLDEAFLNYWKKVSVNNEEDCLVKQEEGSFLKEVRALYQQEFINKCKTDSKFSEKWGLKIEERELSLEERIRIYALKEGQTYEEFVTNWNTDEQWLEDLSDTTIPTKLIIITYNNKTIESYE